MEQGWRLSVAGGWAGIRVAEERSRQPSIASFQNQRITSYLFFFINLFVYLFLAALGLCCGVRASHCGGFSCCGARALGAWASVVAARGLSSCGAWA